MRARGQASPPGSAPATVRPRRVADETQARVLTSWQRVDKHASPRPRHHHIAATTVTHEGGKRSMIRSRTPEDHERPDRLVLSRWSQLATDSCGSQEALDAPEAQPVRVGEGRRGGACSVGLDQVDTGAFVETGAEAPRAHRGDANRYQEPVAGASLQISKVVGCASRR